MRVPIVLVVVVVVVVVEGAAGSKRRFGNFVFCESSKQHKYSAAWLASTSLLASWPAEFLDEVRLTRPGTMMEGASFMVFEGPPGRPSSVYKSLDLLDFYVEHLSWYERRLATAIRGHPGQKQLAAFARSAFRRRVGRLARRPVAGDPRIVAVMPFYSKTGGQGPSAIAMRATYLNATIATARAEVTPHVVVAVENAQDFEVVRTLDLFDVLYLPDLAKPDKLGAAALVALHRVASGEPFSSDWVQRSDKGYVGPSKRWRFDYVYYTEADQLARLKSLPAVLAILDAAPASNVVVPRRAVPLPVSADFDFKAHTDLQATLLATPELRTNDALRVRFLRGRNDTCCFRGPLETTCKQVDLLDRQGLRRADHTLLRRPDGFALVPGEGNFLKMLFRPCALYAGRPDIACSTPTEGRRRR